MDKKRLNPEPYPYEKEGYCCGLYGEYCYPCNIEDDVSKGKKASKK